MELNDEIDILVSEPVKLEPVKPFYILLGETESFIREVIKSNGFKRIMFERQGAVWTLDKTNNGLYWDLRAELETLKHQFMIFKNPRIYIFFNYRGNVAAQEVLKRFYKIIEKDLVNSGKHQIKIVVCGLNFRENNKVHKKIKTEILTWCLKKQELDEDFCDYLEFNELLVEYPI